MALDSNTDGRLQPMAGRRAKPAHVLPVLHHLSPVGPSTNTMPYREKINSLIARYWARIDENGPPHPYDETLGRCHLWTAYCDREGYGRIGFHRKGGLIKVHRLAWMFAYNCDPGYWLVRHSCDNPPCVNPVHLLLGLDIDNMHEKMAKGRAGTERRDMSNVPRGSAHHQSHLTDEQVEEIIARHAAHEMIIFLAQEFRVHPNTISRIVNRKSWRHLRR